MYAPVSIDSFRIQFPVSKTASQCIIQPCDGISNISPGTSKSVEIVSLLYTHSPVSFATEFCSFRVTVQTSELFTVAFNFF